MGRYCKIAERENGQCGQEPFLLDAPPTAQEDLEDHQRRPVLRAKGGESGLYASADV